MKKGLILFLLIFSQSIFARTYIQCRSMDFEDLFMVINLSKERNTMFVTTGMQNPTPNNKLRSLHYFNQDEENHVYESSSEDEKVFMVKIPSNAIETFNNNFEVFVTPKNEMGKTLNFSCYNNIFDEK